METNSDVDFIQESAFESLLDEESKEKLGKVTCMANSGKNRFIAFGT